MSSDSERPKEWPAKTARHEATANSCAAASVSSASQSPLVFIGQLERNADSSLKTMSQSSTCFRWQGRSRLRRPLCEAYQSSRPFNWSVGWGRPLLGARPALASGRPDCRCASRWAASPLSLSYRFEFNQATPIAGRTNCPRALQILWPAERSL